jgi:hypothetical protein
VVRHRSGTHVRIEETARRTAEVTWNGNMAHTDTKIIARTPLVRGVVPGVGQGQIQARRAGGHGGDRQGGDS